MDIISPSNSLKKIMKELPTTSTAAVGQLMMVFDEYFNPTAKMQAPTGEFKIPIQPAATKPTASAQTMGIMWLIGPDANGYYMQSVVLEDTSTTPSTYSWADLGTTQLDLSTYEAPESEIRNIVKNWTPST